MKNILFVLTLLALFLSSCGSSQSVTSEVEINASPARVWEVITDPQYAKVLGQEFAPGSFIESDWQLGSEVYFKSGEEILTTGTISKLTPAELIRMDYDFSGMAYTEKFELAPKGSSTIFKVFAGPYSTDYEDQVVVWKNWQLKVKELSEAGQE